MRRALVTRWPHGDTMRRPYQPLFTQLPSQRDECWRQAAKFIEFWHDPLSDRDGASDDECEAAELRLGVRLPIALREWHSLAGKRWKRLHQGATAFAVNEFVIGGNALTLRTEKAFMNRLTIPWGIRKEDLANEDPPVWTLWRHIEPSICVNHFSHFTISCLVYDAVRADRFRDVPAMNEVPFPTNGKQMAFPESFGVIKTKIHEGPNWLALVSGSDWYLRIKDPNTGQDALIKHEVRNHEEASDPP